MRIMDTQRFPIPAPLTPQQLREALDALDWKQIDFCRRAGLNKDTPSRWLSGGTPIPLWVSAYLDAMLDLQRLADKYLRPIKPATAPEPADSPAAPVPARLAHHLLPRAPQP
jgi:transcriptional regulator with XRE-family HTH domain